MDRHFELGVIGRGDHLAFGIQGEARRQRTEGLFMS
jgi:hypothetical protein